MQICVYLTTAISLPASNQWYKFQWLPFGLYASQDLFQETMDKVTCGLEAVISIQDDIVVLGSDEADHDRNLYALGAGKCGIIFNGGKTFVKVPEVVFFGNNYGAECVKPDPKRVLTDRGNTQPEHTTGAAIIPWHSPVPVSNHTSSKWLYCATEKPLAADWIQLECHSSESLWLPQGSHQHCNDA